MARTNNPLFSVDFFYMYSPPLTSFRITSTEDDLRSCDLAALPLMTGEEMLSGGAAFDDDEALLTMPAPPLAATTALSRIEDNVLENL